MSKQSLATRGRPKKALATLASVLATALLAARAEKNTRQFPLIEYQQDPVGFARDILGMECCPAQVEMLESLVLNTYTAVRSGRRTGKTVGMAAAALWRYCCFLHGQVILSSTTSPQLENLWGDVKMLHAQSGLCVDCKNENPDAPRPCPHSAIIPEEIGATSKSGLKGKDLRYKRFILGKTSRNVSSASGFGGHECLILLDECSGIDDRLFAGYLGSLAGGGAALIAGQPHYRHGYFFEAFKSERWRKFKFSSKETPNYENDNMEYPGLATREWVDGEIQEHGETSSHVAIHILGEFPTVEASQLFGDERIKTVLARYKSTEAKGRLHIGIDPAGDGNQARGDMTSIAARRGYKIIEIQAERGLNDDQILAKLLGLIAKHKVPGEVPIVNFDFDGGVGKNLSTALKAYVEKNPNEFEVWRQRSSDNAKRERDNYDKHRDGMAANFDRWVREGGTFPNDPLLIQEIELLSWEVNARGRAKITPKEVYRRELKRSPDRLDSVILSCWQAPGVAFDEGATKTKKAPTQNAKPTPQKKTLGYGGAKGFWQK